MSDLSSPATAEAGRLPHLATTRLTGWRRWVPGLQTIATYQAAWLKHDITAGLVLTTMLVPVGIAYAVASGVPGIYGLYATIVPLLAYALFGPSRILVLGPDSSLAPSSSPSFCRCRTAIPARAIAAGQLDGGGIRAGLHRGRVAAAWLHHGTAVKTDPLRLHERHRADRADQPAAEAVRFFGRWRPGHLRDLILSCQSIVHGKANWTAFTIGAGTLVVILLLKPCKRIPGILIAVVGATSSSALLSIWRRTPA